MSKKDLIILGISAYYHSSAATLVINGEIISSAEEERFTRIKHDKNFPINSINFCLNESNIKIDDIDVIAYYEKPFLKFTRIISSYISNFPKGFQSYFRVMPKWLNSNLFFKKKIQSKLNFQGKINFCSHHISHMASAYYPSPFNSAAIITMDGVGEWQTISIGIGIKNKITLLREINFPHSLGLFYSSFTLYCGFKVNSGEYKLMGLAPYGEAVYTNKILNNLIDIKDDGSFNLNMKFFDFDLNENMINENFINLFGKPIRNADAEITKFYMDIAASVQKVLEICLIKICYYAKKITKMDNLCLAGGVALNCVANSKILNEDYFKDIWIQPASGDSGASLGSALYTFYDNSDLHSKLINSTFDSQKGSYLGNKYDNDNIKKFLDEKKIPYEYLKDIDLNKKIALCLSNDKVVGRFSGKMEFGPRALGNRSILANPLHKEIQQKLNLKIKFRENFRPFAPAVMFDKFFDYFELKNSNANFSSPYMLFVGKVKGHEYDDQYQDWKERLKNNKTPLPGITHVDGSARIQTVHPETNKNFYEIINEFYRITTYPVIINTSFNIRGEPIVESPNNAFRCFMNTGIDILVLENYFIDKKFLNIKNDDNYLSSFELD